MAWLNFTSGCGPFGAVLSNNSLPDSLTYGWDPCGDTHSSALPSINERNSVKHTKEQYGGTMCCRDTVAGYCQSQEAQNCAGCAKFGPCLNSVDPKCFSTDALDCLACGDYAVCGMCAPGWDVGCIAEEWHQAGESDKPAFKINNDGTLNITNQTTYELGTSCHHVINAQMKAHSQINLVTLEL